MTRLRQERISMIGAACLIAAGAATTAEEPARNREARSSGTELSRQIDRLQELVDGDLVEGESDPTAAKFPEGILDPAHLLEASAAGSESRLTLDLKDVDLDTAATVYALALRLAEEKLGKSHWMTASLAAMLTSRRRMAALPPEGQLQIRRAQKLEEEAARSTAEGKHTEAAERYRESSGIHGEQLGPDDATTLTSLFEFSKSLHRAKDHRGALRVLREAEEICAGAPAAKTPLPAFILDAQSGAHYALEEHDHYVDCFRRASLVWKEIAGAHSPEYFGRLRDLFLIVGALERFEELERVCREAIEAAEPIKHRREVAEWLPLFHGCLGRTYYKQNDHERAVESLGRAVVGMEKSPRKYEEVIIDVYEMYAKSLDAAGRAEEADRARTRAAAWQREADRASEFPLPE